MTLPVWPAGLGELRPDYTGGLTVAPFKPRLVTEFDDGPPRSRRASLVDTTKFASFKLKQSLDQLSVFNDFVRVALNGGTMRFTAPLVTSIGTVAIKVCRIDEGPTTTYQGGLQAESTFDLIVWAWR